MNLTPYRSPLVQYVIFYLQELPLGIPHSHVRPPPALRQRRWTSCHLSRLLPGLSAPRSARPGLLLGSALLPGLLALPATLLPVLLALLLALPPGLPVLLALPPVLLSPMLPPPGMLGSRRIRPVIELFATTFTSTPAELFTRPSGPPLVEILFRPCPDSFHHMLFLCLLCLTNTA